MPTLNVTHQTGDQFQLQVRGHRLLCDQPLADGGTDQGPTPTELFVASLAACVGFYARRPGPPPPPSAGRSRPTFGGQLMQLDEPTTADVLARLRRIQGQVGGIIRMVEAGRGCREVVQQISAAGRALDQTGFKILASGLRTCLQDEQAAAQAGYSQDELERLFLQLR
jgi:DNA-binding FrmR family transcriptional regulator